MAGSEKTIVWFRRDLRIDDNPALAAAAKEGSVLPVFIWCPAEYGQYYPGRCSRWWLKQSLAHLGKSLELLGCPLVLIHAEDSTLAALLECVHSISATKVVYNRLYDPISLVLDDKIKNELSALGVSVQSFNGDLLYEPWDVYDENGQAFTTFNEYWEKCMNLPIEISQYLAPTRLVAASGLANVRCCSIDGLGLESSKDVESSNALLSRAWSPGWRNAENMLEEFLSYGLLEYSDNGMKVGGATTSLLSPYLHFGELSVRKVYQLVKMQQIKWQNEGKSEAEESVRLFLRSIGFREYSRYLCFNFPFTHERPFLGNLKYYPWLLDEDRFKSWRQGMTGYPLVDAGMRELWATGWTHNRIRVIVSSFAVKFLQIPWIWGMKYFWDVLLDADLESDILGWQYISGSLPDGHELSRLDSPEVQGQKYDPDGEYVRTWIPELARMPTEWIHCPWGAPDSILQVAGVELGFNYPKPIVELHMARECLDDAISTMWQLDTAAKLAELDGEVVDDNLNNIRNFDIPKVVLKKKLSPSTSSMDQRVLSTNGKNEKSQPTEVKASYKQIIRDDMINASNMDDTGSTANLQVTRKRSSSDSAFNVPSCSSSLVMESRIHDNDSSVLYSGYLQQTADREGTSKCYGLTETTGIVTMCDLPPLPHHDDDDDDVTAELPSSISIGRLVPSTEARIVDAESGQALPPNRTGELWIRGPSVMQGYLRREDATATALVRSSASSDPAERAGAGAGRWLRTGDLCYIDSHGLLHVVDRMKELIKYKAYQVAPAELEDVLAAHPDIHDVAVAPYPDEEVGEIPVACVVRKPGTIRTLQAHDVISFVQGKVAPYKKIRKVVFLDSIPRSPSGKILRAQLKSFLRAPGAGMQAGGAEPQSTQHAPN